MNCLKSNIWVLLVTILLFPFCRIQQIMVISVATCNSCPSGYYYANNACSPHVPSQCPENYIQLDSYCYYRNLQLQNPCPQGYQLIQNVCYPVQNCGSSTLPPPLETSTEGAADLPVTPFPQPEEPSIEIPGVMPPLPPPAEITTCPTDSIFYEGRCRKLVCEQGQLYRGRCLRAVCPDGLVWRGQRCQLPSFVNTIIEIENKILNEEHNFPIQVTKHNHESIVYHTPKPEESNTEEYPPKPDELNIAQHMSTTIKAYPLPNPTYPTETVRQPNATTMPTPATTRTTTTKRPSLQEQYENGCCYIISPRLCRMYGEKWLCRNKRHTRCDTKLCTSPMLYLRSPEVAYVPPTLVMPPNPPLNDCENANCDSDITNNVDCSGCTLMLRDSCSPFCYHYYCPTGQCEFIDQQDYCTTYPGEFGCRKGDGCIWDWCAQD